VFTTTVIVPTYNRPKELEDCIVSLLKQTVKPSELIIVDDGNLESIPHLEQLESAEIETIHVKKAIPGLTESRNKGISLAKGDIVFFFDDDVILHNEYLEEILKVYSSVPFEQIGGVGGMIFNRPSKSLFAVVRKVIEIIFLNSWIEEGRILRSGFFTELQEHEYPLQETVKVDYLPGCAMSYRRDIFSEFAFTEKYRDYGFGEDKDFSFQVSKKYKLFIQKSACLHHLESVEMRPEKKLYGNKYVLGRYLFFKNRVQTRAWEQILFFYALSGYTIIRLLALATAPTKKNVNHLAGIFQAVKDICTRKVPEI